MRGLPLTGSIVVTLIVCGCRPDGRSVIKPPSVDPHAAAEAAIKALDGDGDGKLSETELVGSPGLLAAISKYDTDRDRHLSAEEIAARLESMYSGGVGLLRCQCVVMLGGQPLAGATVRFIPEKFLGGDVLIAEGVTDDNGQANLAVDDTALPEDQRGLSAMQTGVYRVEITHPTRQIPEKYNSQTTLGHEVHPGDRDPGAVFELQ